MPASKASSSESDLGAPLRVIVIGAGISGLACARELQHRRYQVLVVEGSQRCGGRLKGECLQTASATGADSPRQTGLENSSSQSPFQHCVDVGGALIHGIQENPVMRLVEHMGIATHKVADCVLLDQDGKMIDNKVDDDMSALFNDCLEDTFQRIKQGESTNTRRRSAIEKASNEEVAKTASPSSPQPSFGSLLRQVVQEHRTPTFDSLLYEWHKANLELSCGDSFENLGYTWNDDEQYGYDGEHVALEPSWRAVVENLQEPLDVLYEAQVQKIEYQMESGLGGSQADAELVRGKRSIKATVGFAPAPKSPISPHRRVQNTRHSRRFLGEDANLRRSGRSTKGTPAVKLSIADAASLSYDEPIFCERRIHDTNRSSRRGKGETRNMKSRPPPSVWVTVQRHGKTLVLDADAVVCTLPLGILKISKGKPGHVVFNPPLPQRKKTAIDTLGCGLLNKCVVSFPYVFWPQDTDFLGMASDPPHLVLNASLVTGKPILVFMFGGVYARRVESKTDREIVEMCLDVLRKACGNETVPEPMDYVATRWGQNYFARGAFVYIPPGVEGTQQLEAMADPISTLDGRPVVQFAGEHTTPYHPSTIHGAFLSGIREAYRLDLTMEPVLNQGLAFEPGHIYGKTFPVKRSFKRIFTTGAVGRAHQTPSRRRRDGVMTLRKRKPQQRMYVNIPVPVSAVAHPLPSRRSQRQVKAKVNAHGTVNGLGLSLEDRTMLRSFESYRSWPLIQSRVFPATGSVGLSSDSYRTAEDLRTAHRQLVRLQGVSPMPEPTSIALFLTEYSKGRLEKLPTRNGEYTTRKRKTRTH